jgi:hypothetical protein
MDLVTGLRQCDGSLGGFLEAALPGRAAVSVRLREDTYALCRDLLARGALIVGPPGSGKSTLARIVALGCFVARTTPAVARDLLATVTLDGPARIASSNLPWYEELSLPGLVPSVAVAQVQGHAASVAGSDGRSRPGLFERAALGQAAPGAPVPTGAALTGGVVFLDEVADLHASLQPLLLSLVTGAPVYRVGEEGHGGPFRFKGLTLAATWRDLSADGGFRRDLWQRLARHVLRVPSLAERREEFPEVVASVVEQLRAALLQQLAGLAEHCHADVAGITAYASRVREWALAPGDHERLGVTDWAARGELRGLGDVVGRAMSEGKQVACVLERAPLQGTSCLPPPLPPPEPPGRRLLEQLLALPPEQLRGRSLKAVLRSVERAARWDLKTLLQAAPGSSADLAAHLGHDVEGLRAQVRELGR